MAANSERGEVDLVVKDKSYVLRMRTADMAALQKRSGRTYGQHLTEVDKGNVEAIAELLFMFLQPYHAKQFKKIDDVYALMDDMRDDKISATEPIIEIWTANLPKGRAERSGGPANPTEAQDAGTGDNSGSMPEATA